MHLPPPPSFRRSRSWLGILGACLAAGRAPELFANPTGLAVVTGSATAQANGSQLNLKVGPFAFLNWSSFNIQPGETTTFQQPSAGAIVINNIGGNSPSRIWGGLYANGTVILANANGFYFGPNSFIKVGGDFIATTAPLPPDTGGGAGWTFTGMPPLASIVNYGSVQTGSGRSLYLIAEQIENHGNLTSPGGDVRLYAGQEVLVSERPDGRGLSARLQVPAGAVDNTGRITADAGTISLQAQVVNQGGILQADSIQNHNGVIELIAGGALNLGANSQILARGDTAAVGSPGGNVTLKAGDTFADTPTSTIITTGGTHGGSGGNVEVSAGQFHSLDSAMDARAQSGAIGGALLLDPVNITLGTSGSGTVGAGGTVAAGGGSSTLALNVNKAFANKNFSSIDLQATANITLLGNTTWNLSQSTGVSAGQLTLQAGGDIVFNNGAQIVDANQWSVNLQAGVNFATGTVQPGLGNLYLNGGAGKSLNGAISTAAGSIHLEAGNSILVGSGYVRTTAGGAVQATALSGDINAGTANGGYQFSIFGYAVSPNLGGISTAAGGDVTLTAGHNITSSPTVPANQAPGASGAYGPQPGDVTLTAGNQVIGNYLVANGSGTILAGVTVQNGAVSQVTSPGASVGNVQHPVSLSLIAGSWNVWAAQDIYLTEVRNPNGTFNANQLTVPGGAFLGNVGDPTVPVRSSFLFDYAANAAANLWAGNAITLTGANLPRVLGQDQNLPPVYPPILTLNAGAGGINLQKSLLLFPSAEGALHITTRDGGNLAGAPAASTLTGITMSDSSQPGWATFGQENALTPLHWNDPHPITLDIAGGIQSFGLTVPTFATIKVAGGTYNFGFAGRNLSPAQTTAITIAGDLTYRGNLTSVALTDPLPAVLFNSNLSGSADVAMRLQYNATSGQLTFIGRMTAAELAFLLNPTKLVLDADGNPVLDANGNPQTTPVPLDATQSAAVQQLYTASQTASLGDQGLALAGPGHFNISARNIDLGISGGITVLPPDSALAAISPFGADLNVTAAGDLSMTSTKIANESYLGAINLHAGGTLDVGGQFTTYGDPNAPKGIFTTSGGDTSVIAGGNVNVNGSRIAAYNGGNVTVTSQNGDVNAGAGGSGYVTMSALELDPATGQLVTLAASIPGSGILATTLPGSTAPTLGNITIKAPNGSIEASLGGVIQIAFNSADSRAATIDLSAGHDIDAGGSGIIGGNLKLQAGGDINGLVVGSGQVNINSLHNVDVVAFAGGGISIAASGNVSGTAISPVVSVSGESITASLIGGSVAAAGDSAHASQGVPASNVSVSQARVADDASTTATSRTEDADPDGAKRKPRPAITLARRMSRVTVVLPAN